MQQHLMQMQPMMAAYYPNNVTTDHIQQVLYFLPSSILQPFSFFFFFFIFTLLSFYFPSRSFMSLLRGTFFFFRLCALVLCGSYCATFSSTYRSIIIPSSSFYSLSVSAMFAQMLSLFFLFAFWKFRNMCCCSLQTIISLT